MHFVFIKTSVKRNKNKKVNPLFSYFLFFRFFFVIFACISEILVQPVAGVILDLKLFNFFFSDPPFSRFLQQRGPIYFLRSWLWLTFLCIKSAQNKWICLKMYFKSVFMRPNKPYIDIIINNLRINLQKQLFFRAFKAELRSGTKVSKNKFWHWVISVISEVV